MEKKSNIQIEGVKITNTMKTGKHCRNSGGLALIYKSKFNDWISIQKSSPNFLKNFSDRSIRKTRKQY